MNTTDPVSTSATDRARERREAAARDDLVHDAGSAAQSPFDYIVVGSGAGGGPLACRLALAGKRVLLLEAGGDPHKATSAQFPRAAAGEINEIPAYHGAATEDHELSWQYSVRHYANTATQKADAKYNRLDATFDDGSNPPAPYPAAPRFLDPGSRSGRGQGGIFYPRSSNIGGCTAHHAMIVIAPNDCDWNYVADLTGDESWRAGNMRGYFARMERCLYPAAYNNFLRKALGLIYRLWRWLVLQFDPRAVLDDGGHGQKGWQPTSFIDPALIENIAKNDKNLLGVLARSALSVLHASKPLTRMFAKALFRLRIVQQLDYNDINTRQASPQGVFLIPLGVESDPKSPRLGRRVGVREFILDTQAKHPDRLVVVSGVHVTRVIFDGQPGEAPRAVGVDYAQGEHLYEASPLQTGDAPAARSHFFVKTDGEVILSGGAFNTPQILMLSGIGDAEVLAKVPADPAYRDSAPDAEPCVLRDRNGQPLRDKTGAARRVHLPGVGRNLQDRYEVTVVSEMARDFSTLNGVSFAPGDPNDPARTQWLMNKGGLYRTNGGTIAILKRSDAREKDRPEADLFTFGAPAAFRGYYWGWSRELFRATLGGTANQHNLWSWVILKAYTQNHAGRVTLRTTNPFHAPDICFDSFNEQAEAEAAAIAAAIEQRRAAGEPYEDLLRRQRENDRLLEDSRRDLAAVVEMIKTVRAINAQNSKQFVNEVQPGVDRPDDSAALKDWIKTQAWGHHCSCTCRIGSDAWQADTAKLNDRGGVLDSHFRVQGVRGLRVVDASVFPKIPGYFILAPIFMVSEKAADTLLKDRPEDAYYPSAFERVEARAIRERRKRAHVPVGTGAPDRIPTDTVGLAFSGGGIRSATFSLGVMQALAERNRLRNIDVLSSVSGGGFAATFLGRLFTRDIVTNASDPAGRAQEIVTDTGSGPLWWLRTNANYIFATGAADFRNNVAVFWRNIIAVHLVIGTLLFGVFGLAAWLPGALGIPALPAVRGLVPSVWWGLAAVVFALGLVPATLGYWLAPKPGSYRSYPPFVLLAWVVLLAGSTAALLVPHGLIYASGGIGVLVLSWLWVEGARFGAARSDGPEGALRVGAIARNRFTRALGEIVVIVALLVAWAILDTVAYKFATATVAEAMAAIIAALGPLLPILRWIGMRAQQKVAQGGGVGTETTAKLLGVGLALVLLFAVDVLAHRLVTVSPGWSWGIATIGLALAFSLTLGQAFDFLNLSSLHATYAARLTRTFQGASNESRVYASSSDDSRDVSQAHPGDDIPFDRYHPEQHGGPLHYINVCINETVDLASDRLVRERKSLPMCLTPHGVSVGRSYFARWAPPDGRPAWQKWRRWFEGIDAGDDLPEELRRRTALAPVQTASSPNAFHVFASRHGGNTEVQSLTLGGWTAISGAAFGTGLGHNTSPSLSLFLGIANVRLGFWWDSGLHTDERPGHYPLSLWRRIKRLPVSIFRMQCMLLAEWRGRFRGPSAWLWNLSDGGHFEVTGLYELVRRRVPFMVLVDSGEDADYQWLSLAELIREVREDFGAQVTWIDPGKLSEAGVPQWVLDWFDPTALAPLNTLKRVSPQHAALARVTYDSGHDEPCWLLLLKPGLSDDIPQDVLTYATQNLKFPQDPTADQVFSDSQWESYRKLGQSIGLRVLRAKADSSRVAVSTSISAAGSPAPADQPLTAHS